MFQKHLAGFGTYTKQACLASSVFRELERGRIDLLSYCGSLSLIETPLVSESHRVLHIISIASLTHLHLSNHRTLSICVMFMSSSWLLDHAIMRTFSFKSALTKLRPVLVRQWSLYHFARKHVSNFGVLTTARARSTPGDYSTGFSFAWNRRKLSNTSWPQLANVHSAGPLTDRSLSPEWLSDDSTLGAVVFQDTEANALMFFLTSKNLMTHRSTDLPITGLEHPQKSRAPRHDSGMRSLRPREKTLGRKPSSQKTHHPLRQHPGKPNMTQARSPWWVQRRHVESSGS